MAVMKKQNGGDELRLSKNGTVTTIVFAEDATQISFIANGFTNEREGKEREEEGGSDGDGQMNPLAMQAPVMLVHRPKRLAQSLRNRRIVRVNNMASSSSTAEPTTSAPVASKTNKIPSGGAAATSAASSSSSVNAGKAALAAAAGSDEGQILNEIENLVKQVKSGALQMNQVIASEKHILDANAHLLDKNVNNVKAQSNHAALQDVNATTKALNGLSLLFASPGSALKGLLFLLWKVLRPVLGLVIIGAVSWFTLTFILFSPKASPTIVMRCAQQVVNAVAGSGAAGVNTGTTAELAEAAASVGLGA